jgi:hypothetical protein
MYPRSRKLSRMRRRRRYDEHDAPSKLEPEPHPESKDREGESQPDSTLKTHGTSGARFLRNEWEDRNIYHRRSLDL